MNLLTLTPSELQHWESSLKCSDGIQGGAYVSGIKARAGGSFLPDRKVDRATELAGAISETPPTWPTRSAPLGRSPEAQFPSNLEL